MNCPLCNTKKSMVIRRSPVIELKSLWLSAFGFDPFPSDFAVAHIDKMRCASCHLEYFHPSYHGEADFYEKISKQPWYYEQEKWEFDVAAELVSKLGAGGLLEIGCGNGFFLEKIASLGLDVEGIDINRDAVATCKAKGLNVESIDVFDMTKSYDVVVMFQVLEHMENAKDLFGFITTKLLRPEGHLIIAVPNPDGYLKEMGTNLLDMPPHHNSCWSLSTFEHLQAQFGLQLMDYQREPLRYVHYLGMLQAIVGNNAKLAPAGWKSRILTRLQMFVVRMTAATTYLRDRERVEGQTHLVLLKNVR